MKWIFALPFLCLACGPALPALGTGSDAEGPCNAEPLGDLIGRPATAEMGAEALRRSRSSRLRWIRPGDAVTMDFNAHRLNIRLDASNRIESFDCG